MKVLFSKMSVDMVREIAKNIEWKITQTATKPYNCALVPCGFDIETTNEFMYIWTLTLGDVTFYGYTFFDLKVCMGIIKQALGLGTVHKDGKKKATRVLPVFVHNFGGFEWHFIKYELKITDKFLRGSDKDAEAMYAVAYDSFLFVDSMAICPKMSLDELAKTYCHTRKMVGDLDYSVERNTEDAKHLSDEEMKYCINDTVILAEFAQYVYDNYFKKYDKLPFTQNQIVGSAITKAFEEERLSISDKKALEKLKKFYEDEFLDQATYRLVREYGFRGGYCGSSYRYFRGKIGYGDLDAAYTAQIVHAYYPRGRYTKLIDTSKWKSFAKDYCWSMRVRFVNLRAKSNTLLMDSRTNIITKDKVDTDEAGKVAAVYGTCTVCITEIHYKLYKLIYDWDSMEVLTFKYCERGELPWPVKKTVLEFYKEKAKLKKAGLEDTQEYAQVKSMPSTVFGAMGKRVYGSDLDDLSEVEWWTKYHGLKLRPQWGVYVAAHVRYLIVTMILKLGSAWLYSDTDSIYYVWSPETQKLFDDYNAEIRAKNKAFCEKYGYDYAIYDDLGTFDDKHRKNFKIDEFITTGTKCYAYHYTDKKHPEGAYEIVMAGIPKEAVREAWEKSGLSFEEFFGSPYQIIEFDRKMSEVVHNTHARINGEIMECRCGVRIHTEHVKGTIRMVKNRLAFETWYDKVNDDLAYYGDD